MRTVNPSLLLLILVWVAILLPGALRSRLRPSPRASVGGFQRSMDGLKVPQRVVATHVPAANSRSNGQADGRAMGMGATVNRPYRVAVRHEDPVVARRRRRTLRLFSLTALALVAAPLLGGAVWLVAGSLLATSVTTAAILRRIKLQRDAARTVLVSLDLRRPAQPLVDEITGELVLAAGSSAAAVRLPSWRG
ncbi:MAG: hypothetical protein O3C70_03875 [Actinomycetota bacterium]|nr:hypothetical protein [Actinomycetota bacterium]